MKIINQKLHLFSAFDLVWDVQTNTAPEIKIPPWEIMDIRIPRNIEIFKIQNCQALWFLIDIIHEMNQIVRSINIQTGALEKTHDSQDGDAGVSQHFVSLVYHVDYIWDYFGPILRLLWSDHCSG